MAEDLLPTTQPAFMGEWTYSSANTAPPATAQLRLNTSSQANATSIYVHNITFNGIDARDWLMDMSVGSVIRLEEKNAPARWHTFTISSTPIQQSGYVELKVTWKAGGQNLTTSVMVSVVSSVVRVTGSAISTSAGTASVTAITRKDATVPVTGIALVASTGDVGVKGQLNVVVEVTGERLRTDFGHVAVSGQLITRDFAYPFVGNNYTSPGMTLRQYYAAQAMVGFLANGGPIANLIGGKAIQYCFQLADNMIAFERKEADGEQPPLVGEPRRVA